MLFLQFVQLSCDKSFDRLRGQPDFNYDLEYTRIIQKVLTVGGIFVLKDRKSNFITIVLIIAALLTYGEAFAGDANTFTISKKIQLSDNRLLTLQFNGSKSSETETGGYSSIKVYEEKNKLLQTINISEVNPFGDDSTNCPDPGTGSDIAIEDMNFDGIRDFRIVAMLPAGPNIPYICFLWDKKSGRFIHAEFLDDITSPQFDSKTKTITSDSRESANIYRKDIYKYSNGRPLLTESVITEYKKLKDTNGALRLFEIKTTKKLIDGKMQVVNIQKTPK